MNAIFSISPFIDDTSKDPLYYQLYEYIKKEIIKGNMKGGEKLPSLRELSKCLRLSKNTIEVAYQQLHAEGYIKSVPKVGYKVIDIGSDFSIKFPEYPVQESEILASNPTPFKYDLAPRYGDISCFNIRIWKKILNSIINDEFERLLNYGDPQGEYELRREIARHIYANRGVYCRPEQIVVGAGTQYCLNIVCQMLKPNYKFIGMEDPGSYYIRSIFENHHFDIEPIPVLRAGLDVSRLENSKCKLVFVTPSHQFPKGVIMSAKNRLQLLRWAKRNNGLIIEDDYDSEIRFAGKPIPSLKSWDTDDKVIYIGSFSKILMPTLRIGFMVMPPWLLNLYLDQYRMNEQTTSMLNQLVLARFMREGYLQSHIRKIRRHYHNKYHIITKAIRTYMRENVNLISSSSGMRIILEIKTERTEAEILQLAHTAGINIVPLSRYYIKNDGESNGKIGILLSYKGIPTEDIEPAIRVLSKVSQGTVP